LGCGSVCQQANAGTYIEVERLEHEVDQLKKYFDLPQLSFLHEPSTIVDGHGRILVWHLPDILSVQRVVSSQNLFPYFHLLIGAKLLRVIITMQSTTSAIAFPLNLPMTLPMRLPILGDQQGFVSQREIAYLDWGF
jgi:hypothetical protein